jgi:hypothetical protein
LTLTLREYPQHSLDKARVELWPTMEGARVSFFHGCVIALKIEATAVFAAWFAVRFWQVLT